MRKLLLLFFMGSPVLAAIPPAFVQAKTAKITSTAASGFTATAIFNTPPIRGNMFIVDCAGNGLGGALVVADDQNDVFTLVGGTTTTAAASGAALEWGIWYSSSVLGDFTSITCTDVNGNVTWLEMSAHEYSGQATGINPFDVASSSSAAASRSTTTVVSGYVTTGANNVLVHSFTPKTNSAPIAGNGTIRTSSVDNAYWTTQDAVVTDAGVYQSSFTCTNSLTTNYMSQASFKPPPDPPPGVHSWQ